MKTAHIAIFASGAGTNALKIVEYFSHHSNMVISAVFTNKKEAGVVEMARKKKITAVIFSREDFYETDRVMKKLEALHISHIVLAGFLWLIPKELIKKYPDRIINIHPALLPKYGGKGMYGKFVHEAVKMAGEEETGITIHLVNENYDEGEYILQKKVALSGHEMAEDIAKKVQILEHEYFPKAIEDWIKKTY